MPPRKKGRGRGRGADTLASQPVDLNDDEISDTSQTSNIETKKEVLDRERKYPWKDGHQETLAEFWLNHPIFYDKTQEHYKNSQMKCQLIRDLIEQHHNEWEELYKPLPTVSQVEAHLRNIRTRFGKLITRKSGSPAVVLSFTDQKILDRYMFLRPHIARNKTKSTHTFGNGGDADDDDDDDDGDDIDDDQSIEDNASQTSTRTTGDRIEPTPISQAKPTGKAKRKRKRPTPSPLPESPDLPENQILQQAQNLISSIRQPPKSDHERRVRDFSRYMESEMLRIPESSWDECSFTIMTVIRGFKTSQHLGAGHVVNISQPSVYQQTQEQQAGYLTQTFNTAQQPNTIQPPGSFQPSLGNIQQAGLLQQPTSSAFHNPVALQQSNTLQQFGNVQQQSCALQQPQRESDALSQQGGSGGLYNQLTLRPLDNEDEGSIDPGVE